MKLLKPILATMVLCLTGFGSQVVSVHSSGTAVAVTHGATQAWLEDEELCVYSGGREISCGVVTRSTDSGAILTLDETTSEISVGDSVRMVSATQYADQASDAADLGQSFFENGGRLTIPRFDFSIGVLWFTKEGDSQHGLVELQTLLAGTVTLGVFGSYWNSNQDTTSGTVYLSDAGVGLGLHYYSTEPFHGFWLNVSFSRQFYTYATATSSVSFQLNTLRGSLGWRWKATRVRGGCAIGIGPDIAFSETGETITRLMLRFHLGIGFGMAEIFH